MTCWPLAFFLIKESRSYSPVAFAGTFYIRSVVGSRPQVPLATSRIEAIHRNLNHRWIIWGFLFLILGNNLLLFFSFICAVFADSKGTTQRAHKFTLVDHVRLILNVLSDLNTGIQKPTMLSLLRQHLLFEGNIPAHQQWRSSPSPEKPDIPRKIFEDVAALDLQFS